MYGCVWHLMYGSYVKFYGVWMFLLMSRASDRSRGISNFADGTGTRARGRDLHRHNRCTGLILIFGVRLFACAPFLMHRATSSASEVNCYALPDNSSIHQSSCIAARPILFFSIDFYFRLQLDHRGTSVLMPVEIFKFPCLLFFPH